jgi:Txe/YoeB family toxin of Txe-Axe toxin-antitoxin module
MVSCECEPVDYVDEYYSPEEYSDEVVEDHRVVWTVNDNGVGRVEVV